MKNMFIVMAILFAQAGLAQKPDPNHKPKAWLTFGGTLEKDSVETDSERTEPEKKKGKFSLKREKENPAEAQSALRDSRIENLNQVIESLRLDLRKREKESKEQAKTIEDIQAEIDSLKNLASQGANLDTSLSKRETLVGVFHSREPGGNPIEIVNASDEQIQAAVKTALTDTVILAQILSSANAANLANNAAAKNENEKPAGKSGRGEVPKEVQKWFLDTIAKLNKRMDELNSMQEMFPRLVDEKLNAAGNSSSNGLIPVLRQAPVPMQAIDSIFAGLRDTISRLEGKVSQLNFLIEDGTAENGAAGKSGKPGEKGEKGDPGPTGPSGINGLNGKDGRDGIDGRDGKDGKADLAEIAKLIDDYFEGNDNALPEEIKKSSAKPVVRTRSVKVYNYVDGRLITSVIAK